MFDRLGPRAQAGEELISVLNLLSQSPLVLFPDRLEVRHETHELHGLADTIEAPVTRERRIAKVVDGLR